MTTFLPSVSIVIPVLNGEETIEDCVLSLLELDYPEDKREIIVVDNGSEDRTSTIVKKYGDRIRLISEPRRGRPIARNRGICVANNEVVAFTDADCTADRNWLRMLVPHVKEATVGIVGGKLLAREPRSHVERYDETLHDQEKAIAGPIPSSSSANWASSLGILKALGGFDEQFERGEDSELSYRIWIAGYEIVYSPEAVIFHRNESTVKGLWLKGFRHGFASVRLNKKHCATRKKLGHRRVYSSTYEVLLASLLQFIRDKDRPLALCRLAFEGGKKAGKLAGSVRFRHLQL